MDALAITNASDELLKEMGLSKAGDRLSLKGFCAHDKGESSSQLEGSKNRKRALLEAFLSRKKESKKPSSKSKSRYSSIKEPQKQKMKKVQLGWKHFKEQEQSYTFVPLIKGGGSRVVEMAVSSTRMDIFNTCKDLFFPGGNSIFGNEDNMIFSLTNFKGEKVGDSIRVGREDKPFNLCNYMEVHKIKTIRLYLQSRKIDDSDDDSYDGASHNLPSEFDLNQDSLLIGSTMERQNLVNEQDKEFQESLKADQRKAISLETEDEDTKRKERIQNARADRVLPEPDEEYVTVKVRHVTMGLQSRKFPKTARMAALYDWVGSLSSDPENFTISHLGVVQKPSQELSDRCTYLMVEAEHGTPGLLESDDEVQFLGFGSVNASDNQPLPG